MVSIEIKKQDLCIFLSDQNVFKLVNYIHVISVLSWFSQKQNYYSVDCLGCKCTKILITHQPCYSNHESSCHIHVHMIIIHVHVLIV